MGLRITGGSQTASGAAGGVLAGTYPNPSFASDMATQAELDAEASSRATADALLLPLVGGTLSGNLNLADNQLIRALFKDFGEEVQALGTLGATETVDLTLGNTFTGTLDENFTLTLSNPTATGDLCTFTGIFTHDGSGGSTFAVTNGSWLTADGVDPTITTTASATFVVMGMTVNAGTTWMLFYGGCTA